jgi:hypothetical protein
LLPVMICLGVKSTMNSINHKKGKIGRVYRHKPSTIRGNLHKNSGSPSKKSEVGSASAKETGERVAIAGEHTRAQHRDTLREVGRKGRKHNQMFQAMVDTWKKLENPVPFNAGTMLLLTDGTP